MIHIKFPGLFIGISCFLIIFASITTIPCQVIASTRYVASGGNCGGASPCYSTIQAAVDDSVSGDEIRVATGTYSSTSTGGGITAVVRIVYKKITLRGGYTTSNWNASNPTANPTIIDANDNGICIYINYQGGDTGIGHIIIDGFSITDGSATTTGAGTDSGGGIYIDHTTHVDVTIQNCKIYENYAEDGNGGGIWSAWSENLHVLDSEISDNQGSGATVTYGHNLVIVDCTIADNDGDGINVISDDGTSLDIHGNEITGNQGSGINISTASGGSIIGNTISDNHTTGGGGGLDVSGATNDFLISGNIITGNSSMQGGGIDISGSIAEISDNLIESNYTTSSSNGGGGMYVSSTGGGSYVLVSNNRILSNTTSNMAGGLLVVGIADVLGNTITGNSGGGSGGGIVATMTGTIGDNLISENHAKIGGGIRAVGGLGAELTIKNNRVIGNQATNGDGGGMSLSGDWYLDITLDGNQVISNTSTTKGGGIYLEFTDPSGCDPIYISNTVLAKNIAVTGSGLYSRGIELHLAYNTVASNRHPSDAWGDGRGLYLLEPKGSDPPQPHIIENSIIVDQAVGVFVESGSATIESTLWGSGTWANDADTGGGGTIDIGTNNYYAAPVFLKPVSGDYHISRTSPAVDKGVDTWIATDMDGDPRPSGAADIGADENTGAGRCGSVPFLLPLILN